MAIAAQNLRLAELALVTEQNKPVFDDLVGFLTTCGYPSLHAFVTSTDDAKAKATILAYLKRPFPAGIALLDGVARPYKQDRAKWILLGWVMRDAPTQRLQPMVKHMTAGSVVERQAELLNIVREHVGRVLPGPDRWTWNVVFEVILDRLEGSRRAIKGTLFEAIVRRLLSEAFAANKLPLAVHEVELRLEGETFDVSVSGPRGQILIPVKTRETMGGGHALLFTRDIHKSIAAAGKAGFECIPVVIAESWSGDLSSLECRDFIYIDINPNQIDVVEPLLRQEIASRIGSFAALT